MIIFLYGPDTFRSRRKLSEIIKQQKTSQKQGINLKRFDADNINFQDFQDEIRQTSLFQEKKLIILANVFANDDFKKKFLENKEKILKSDDIIVFFEEERILEKDPLFRFLTKLAKIQQFDFLKEDKLKKWVKSEFENYKASVSEKALDRLISFVGNDLWRADQEIKKLVNYKKGGQIEFEDIAVLVKPKIETDIFKTIDAVAEKKKSLALFLLHKHLFVGDSPLYLLAMINYQFRNVLIIKDMAEKRNPYQVILKKSGLKPFVVRKTYQQAQKFTFPELKKIYRKIFQIDSEIKTGRIDAATALDLLIAEI